MLIKILYFYAYVQMWKSAFYNKFCFNLHVLGVAQEYKYSGTVINQTDGKPIESVLVSIGYSEFYTRTDKNGN